MCFGSCFGGRVCCNEGSGDREKLGILKAFETRSLNSCMDRSGIVELVVEGSREDGGGRRSRSDWCDYEGYGERSQR